MDLSKITKKEMRLIDDAIVVGLNNKNWTDEETETINQFRDRLMLGYMGDACYGVFEMMY